MDKSLNKKIVSYALILFVIATLSAGIITLMNNVTNPILEQRANEELQKAFDEYVSKFYTNIVSYETDNDVIDDDRIKDVFVAKLETGETKYIYNMATKGKNGDIKYLVYVGSDGVIENISYISHTETPGKGDKIENEEFTNQFVGSDIDVAKIDTISGASISSGSIRTGISVVKDNFDKNFREAN